MKSEENEKLYDEIREHYEDLQTKVFSDEETYTHYEIVLKNKIGAVINTEDRIVETEIIDSEVAVEIEEKAFERMYEVKTINYGCLGENCSQHKINIYHMKLSEAIDFIRDTIFVAEEFISIKPI